MVDSASSSFAASDIGDYCRKVEDHLTRVNAGHLVRIVGPGFALVRGWAETGVPLSVVFRGIDMKADRHREGQARRPLRIEFCEPDVRAVFENWRRAVGLTTGVDGAPGQTRGLKTPGSIEPDSVEPDTAPKRKSLSRHLDRAIDRLSRVGGRLELPTELRDACDHVLQELAAIRTAASTSRGAARDELAGRLPALDAELADAIRAHAPEALRAAARADAMADLQAYQSRLASDAWERSVNVTADRIVRDRLSLPFLEL